MAKYKCVQLTVPVGRDGQLLSDLPLVLWLSTNAVQLTVPVGGDGQLMSDLPPTLWLSTYAVQLTVHIVSNGQLMSDGPPALWLSTNAVQALFRSSLVPQTFPHRFGCSFPFVNCLRQLWDGKVFPSYR